MGDTSQMHVFHGFRTKDPKQHLFVCEEVYTSNNVHDDTTNIIHLGIIGLVFLPLFPLCIVEISATSSLGSENPQMDIIPDIKYVQRGHHLNGPS